MVRILGFLVGLGFVGVAAWSLLWGAIAYVSDPPAADRRARASTSMPRDVSYSFDGPFGRFDRQQLQRGFQVYQGGLRGLPRPQLRRVPQPARSRL